VTVQVGCAMRGKGKKRGEDFTLPKQGRKVPSARGEGWPILLLLFGWGGMNYVEQGGEGPHRLRLR